MSLFDDIGAKINKVGHSLVGGSTETEHESDASSMQYASSGPIPPVSKGGHTHAMSASDRAFGKHLLASTDEIYTKDDAQPIARRQRRQPPPGEASQAANARALLTKIENDEPAQLQAVTKRVIQEALGLDPHTEIQVLQVAEDFSDAALAEAISRKIVELRHIIAEPNEHGTGTRILLDDKQLADAEKFNAAHPANVESFVKSTQLFSSAADVDAEKVANWQREHKLEADGKVGSGTLHVATTASTKPTSSGEDNAADLSANQAGGTTNKAAASTTGGGGGGGGSHGATGPHPPPKEYLSADPDTAKKQSDLRMKQYAEDPLIGGYVPPHEVNVTLADRMNEIYQQRSGFTRELRLLMVGQSRAEQDGNTLNYNFAGQEPYWMDPPSGGKTSWTRGLRSARITPTEYHAHPEIYLNNPNDDRGTIEHQLLYPAKDGKLSVMFYGPRPAYSDLKAAVSVFISGVESRLNSFESHGSPDVALAKQGEVEPYIRMMHSTDPDGLRAYNAEVDYPDKVRRGVASAKADHSLDKLP